MARCLPYFRRYVLRFRAIRKKRTLEASSKFASHQNVIFYYIGGTSELLTFTFFFLYIPETLVLIFQWTLLKMSKENDNPVLIILAGTIIIATIATIFNIVSANSGVRTNDLTVLLYFFCCVNTLHQFVNMTAKPSFKKEDQSSISRN